MDFCDVVRGRRSVRDYDSSKAITDEQLNELFELVKLSPSSYNLQPWKFIVVRNYENKKRLGKCANGQRYVEGASAVVVVLGSTHPESQAEGIAADRMAKGTMDAEKKKLFDAAVSGISEDKARARIWTVKSASLAAMTLMLAAKNVGLASCPMEGFDGDCIRKDFGVPDDYEVVMLVTLGYASGKLPERPMRYGFGDIVYFERFGEK